VGNNFVTLSEREIGWGAEVELSVSGFAQGGGNGGRRGGGQVGWVRIGGLGAGGWLPVSDSARGGRMVHSGRRLGQMWALIRPASVSSLMAAREGGWVRRWRDAPCGTARTGNAIREGILRTDCCFISGWGTRGEEWKRPSVRWAWGVSSCRGSSTTGGGIGHLHGRMRTFHGHSPGGSACGGRLGED